MTQKQKSEQTLELLNKSFETYFKKYSDTKLDLMIGYSNFTTGQMIISIQPQSKRFNRTLVGECFMMNFIPELIKTNLFKSDNKSWVCELYNEDLPHSVDYKIYLR